MKVQSVQLVLSRATAAVEAGHPVTERRWMLINIVAVPILAFLAALPFSQVTLPLVFAALVVRSIADYA